MKNNFGALSIISWLFGIIIFIVGILNMFLVHPVPGFAYLLLSCIYLPSTNVFLKNKLGFSVPILVKIILGVILSLSTLGVSDLGDMIDKL